MHKSAIVSTVGNLCRMMTDDLQAQLDAFNAGRDIDEDDTKDPEDFSQQTESSEMARLLEAILTQSKQRLHEFERIPFHLTYHVVEPGALVRTNKHVLLVGVAVSSFETEAGTVTGISISAPIYKLLAGKKVGDVVTYRGEEIKILEII